MQSAVGVREVELLVVFLFGEGAEYVVVLFVGHCGFLCL